MDRFTLVLVLLYNNSAFGNNNVANPDPFTQVIPSNDSNDHDDIYVTPAHFFIGKTNGDILRCLYENPSLCETFYSSNIATGVNSIVLRGEYLYASADKNILQCDIYEKSCTTFKTFNTSVNALGLSVGYPDTMSYIYVALQHRLVRCELHKPDNCSLFKDFRGEIKSVNAMGKFMHIGVGRNAIWRCSLAAERAACNNVHTATSQVTGIVTYGNTAIFVSEDGTFYNYTTGRDDVCTQNAYKTSPGARFKSIEAFDRSLYALHDSTIVVCEWGTLGNCSRFSEHEGASSVAFAYRTHRMQKRYVGEDKIYYNITERPKFEVYVDDDGAIYKLLAGIGYTLNTGIAVDPERPATFAMGADGQILVSESNRRLNGKLVTSSMFAGRPVAGAGEIIIMNGYIKSIRACSCHYRTTVELNQQVINALYLRGYPINIDSLPCGEDACH